MKPISISDIVFFMIASTLCFLALTGKATVDQFLGIAGIVFGSFYVHKAQNKTIEENKK